MSTLSIIIDGKKYEGWESIRLNRSMNHLAGSFTAEGSDLYPGSPRSWNIRIGQDCIVNIDNTRVLYGFIDDLDISYSENKHIFSISGRDNTADLVDCSYVPLSEWRKLSALEAIRRANLVSNEITEWKNQSLLNLVKNLCAPYNIDVLVDSMWTYEDVSQSIQTDEYAFKTFNAQGETVAELITKLCLTRAVLPICYGDGALYLTQSGSHTSTDRLVKGYNILQGALKQSNKDRFSNYLVKGQDVLTTGKTLSDSFGPSYEWEDSLVQQSRYRPKLITDDMANTDAECFKRAMYENGRDIAQSRKLVYEVQGITQSDGSIWHINSLVEVEDSYLDINDTLLITEVENEISSDRGSITRLTLSNPEAYERLETPIALGFGYDLNNQENTEAYSSENY